MKTKKFISFLLMFSLLVTMNITPGFAVSSDRTNGLTIEYNSEGGTVTGQGMYGKELVCGYTEHEHPDECYNIVDYDNLTCNITHTSHDNCPTKVVITCNHTHTEACCSHVCDNKCKRCDHKHGGIFSSCYTWYGLVPVFTCPHRPWHEWAGILDCPEDHCKHIVCDDACKTEGCKHTHGPEEISYVPDCEEEIHVHNDNCYGRKTECTDPHHSEDCYDWSYASVIAEPNHGWFILSVTIDQTPQSIENPLYYSTRLYMNQNHWVKVVFAEQQLTVTGKPNNPDYGSVEGGGPVDYNGSVTLEAKAKRGYRFVKWDDENTDNPRTIENITESKEYTAIFEALTQFTVTTGTTGSGSGSVEVKVNGEVSDGPYYEGDKVTITATPDAGSYFAGWIEYPELGDTLEFDSLNEDVTLTAIFEKILPGTCLVTVIADPEEGGSVSGGGLIVYGENASLSANPSVGYKFVRWENEDGETIGEATTIEIPNVTSDRTITAIFEMLPEPYLIVTFNQTGSVPGKTNAWTITNPTENKISYTWSLNDRIYSEEDKNTIQNGKGEVEPGQSISVVTDVVYNPDTLLVIYHNQFGSEVIDTATAKMYTWITGEANNGSFTDDNGNTLSTEPTYYFAGSTVQLTANPSSGYRFVNGSWDIDPDDEYVQVSTSGSTATIVISDFTPPEEVALYSAGYPTWTDGIRVTADFELIPATPSTPSAPQTTYYTLNVGVEGPGKVNPTSGIYAAGSRVALTHQADEGAQFIGWFGINGSEVNSDNEILMNSNKSLIARFELIPDEGPEEEEFTDEETPQSGDVTEEEEEQVVLDQEVPYDGPALPQTGGVPMELVIGAGFAFITAGISLRKKGKKEKE